MAYSIGKTSALQTAIKAGVDIAIAEFNAAVASGQPTIAILDRVNEVKDSLVGELFAQADADNAAIAAPAPRAGGFGGRDSNGPVTLGDAQGMVLNFGWAKGLTIGDVLVMSKDDTLAYSNGKYKRSGVDYITWMSQNTEPKAQHAAVRAKVALDDYRATSKDLNKLAGP